MVENNNLYMWDMRRGKDATVKLPLDDIRSRVSAHIKTISGDFEGSTIFYTVLSNQRVYVRQIIATELSGLDGRFAIMAKDASGTTVKLSPTIYTSKSGPGTVVVDTLLGPTAIVSGQRIFINSGGASGVNTNVANAFAGEIGIVLQIDPNVDE